MRKARSLALLAFVTLSSFVFLHAQFQQPTKEELQMTSDPKAPGAAAVYLFRVETTDDALHFHSYYERVKVLTEKGKELATVRVPYEFGAFKVAAIRGRTIHSDGTVIPLAAEPSDLIDVKTAKYQRNTMVFTLPSVEIGSILEYYLQLRYSDNTVSEPTWNIQKPYFVHKAHYFFQPSSSDGITNSRGDVLDKLMYGVHAGNDAKIVRDPTNRYTFDITDVPPIPNDDWMPPLNSINWRVEFYYTNYSTGSEFWQYEGKRWAKQADHFANHGKTLQQAAAEIVAPGDSDDQKAHKLYDAVMKLDNTSFTRQKSVAERKKEKLKTIKDAEGVWQEKAGDEDEIALLYVALARAAGLQAYPMQVVNRNRALFDSTYLSTSQMDDYIAIVVIGGKDVFLDPTASKSSGAWPTTTPSSSRRIMPTFTISTKRSPLPIKRNSFSPGRQSHKEIDMGTLVLWPCRNACIVAAALLATACHPAFSSWFAEGQPIPQWGLDAAKTHTPDNAGDASAVILFDEYLETIDAQGRAIEREREAIRVLKPQGRGNTCEVSFDETEKVNYFRAWTIAADEKQYQAQETDFTERGDTDVPIMLSTRKSRIAHPPAIDVGATIICESEELMEPYLQEKTWSFQNSIPVAFEALEIELPPGRAHTDSWHNHEAVKPVEIAPNHWRWEIKNQPALILRDIPSAPDWAALAQRMTVQWGDAAIEGRDNQWRAIGQWVTTLEATRPDPSPEITAKVQQLIAGAPDFYAKLSRITASIQKDIRYFIVIRGLGGLPANHASDIFRNRYGDCKDKTTLLISILQVADKAPAFRKFEGMIMTDEKGTAVLKKQ